MGLDAEAAVAANNLAWLYVSSNRNLDQALQLAQTAAKQLGEVPQVNDTLGWIYYRKGMFEPAVRHLEKSIQKDATDPSVHYHLGMAYLQLGELDKAKKSLTKGAVDEPDLRGRGGSEEGPGGSGEVTFEA